MIKEVNSDLAYDQNTAEFSFTVTLMNADGESVSLTPSERNSIKGMSFEIEPGTVVGVVGRSGSGKSTISKLIQRLYIPEAGKISVDGMDISLVNPSMLRKQIGVVLQENFMFNGTVAENISIHCKSYQKLSIK